MTMLRLGFFGGVALGSAVAFTPTVVSADGYSAPAPAYYAPAFSWTGLYIGAHTGWEKKRMEGSEFTGMAAGNGTGNLIGDNNIGLGGLQSTAARTKQELDGWIYGGQIGYNHQFGRVVVGTELSGTWGNVDGTADCFSGATFVPGPTEKVTRDCKGEQKWSVQWLNKLGVAHDRLMGYVTGGVAITEVDISRSVLFTDTAVGGGTVTAAWSGSTHYAGVVFGGGLQFALANNLSLGVEYLHTTYASADTLTTGVRQLTGFRGQSELPRVQASNAINDLDADTWRVVLNYKFDHGVGRPLK